MADGSTNSTTSRSTGVAGLSVQTAAGGSMNAAPNGTSNVFGALLGIWRPPPADPFRESGRPGTAVWGGYVENIEKDRRLGSQQNRYRTASDLLANVSIVGAGLRFYLNLTAVPAWSVKPVEDLGEGQSSDEAKKLAAFVEDILDDLGTSWSRIVRRSGMFKFHGFGIHEWTAKRREDGLIGIADVDQRPQHTIERWELADDATILGMWQRWPQNGQLLFLPRAKVIYLVDDMLTDSPEGMGLFRHLVEPAERMRRYLKLEGQGYERDLRGLPVGKAPLEELRRQVAAGLITKEQADQAIAGMEKFLQLQVKEEDSSLLIDSAMYREPQTDGFNLQGDKWAIDLLKSGTTGFADIDKAIDRLTHDMARILGVESLMLGGQGGGSGSKSLSEDKSRNLYLSINATVKDIAEAYRRDMIGAVWALNGLPPKLMPKLHTEDVAFKDALQVAESLSFMAQAGATLQLDDPAINDVRDLLGVSKQPDPTPEMMGLLPRPGDEPPAGPSGGANRPPEPGAAPQPPGSPQQGAPTTAGTGGRRNRTSRSTPHG